MYAFGVLWAELITTVHNPGAAPSMIRRKDDITIPLNNPPSDGFEGKLYEAGLGNKPVVPEVLQDAARTIVYRYACPNIPSRKTGFCIFQPWSEPFPSRVLTICQKHLL